MALVVNETDDLSFILTQYGLDRVTEALNSRFVTLNISKIKIGDANGEYYIPTLEEFKEYNSNLRHPIPDGSFYITEKELLEDNVTISFRAIIPETFSNCEIREVGLYETVNGEDFLFAISTQQPLLKPSEKLDYFISVDYYAFLKSVNLSEVYDQIVLEQDSQIVTQEKLDALMSSILFTESNLMEQVNSNTRVIGLNRNQQLYELIQEEQKNFGYITTYNNCATLLNYMNTEDMYAYWIFDYPRRISASAEIVDIGPKGRNLSTNVSVNNYVRDYKGFASFLNFKNPNYYYMNQSSKELIYSSNDFSLVPVLNNQIQITSDGIAHGFGFANYIQTVDLNTSQEFQITMLYKIGTSSESSKENILFADASGVIEVLARNNNTLGARIKRSNGNVITLDSNLKVNDDTWRYTRLSLKDNTISLESSENSYTWTLLDSYESVSIQPTNSAIYIGRNAGASISASGKDYGFSGSIDLKYFTVYNNGAQIASGGRYDVTNELVFLDESRTKDASVTLAFTVEPLGTGKRTLLARSSYATNSHYFEVNETEDNEAELVLFTDSSNYITFKTSANTVPTGVHSLIIKYDADAREVDFYINGRLTEATKTITGTYTHMNDRPSELCAFCCTTNRYRYANSSSRPTKLFNSDGSPNTDDHWSLQGSNVVYSGNTTTYSAAHNKQADKLYAWTANSKYVYTKETTVSKGTLLYNNDYTLNTEFKIVQSGSEYVIEYNSVRAVREQISDIPQSTLYAFMYTGNLETIWANNNYKPVSLYYYNGDLYRGDQWKIVGDYIYFDDIKAEHTPEYNREIPSVPITSYVTSATGELIQLVNSKIASVTVLKSLLTDNEVRSLALLLEATRGQNPCVYTV